MVQLTSRLRTQNERHPSGVFFRFGRGILNLALFSYRPTSVARWEATEKTIEYCFLLSFLLKARRVTKQFVIGEVNRLCDRSGAKR